MTAKKRVLVAMSGGVDSSVAAVLLQQQGFDIVGITIKTYNNSCMKNYIPAETGCCNINAFNDALSVAVKYDFPHYIIDLSKEFEQYIVKNFVDEYLEGHTPNPCVICNNLIKWKYMLEKADQLNCDFIATGHYSQIRFENGRYILSKAIDATKDQSYVLWGLNQEQLSRTMFPLGGYHKTEIKKLANQMGFVSIAEKRESYEICFITDNDYRNFLVNKVDGLEEKVNGGNFVDVNGKILGQHKGYPFYTIGQRKGLQIAVGEPLYVNKIIKETNTIVLGKKEDLLSDTLSVKNINLIKYADVNDNMEVVTKIRYRDKGTVSFLNHQKDTLTINFTEKISSVTSGQSAVFYEGDDVVGGGIII